MFATNHVLSGVVIGRLLERHPFSAFVVGVASHLALDMVPHWGCELKTQDDWARFVCYAQRDGITGLVVALAATGAVRPQARAATLAAIAGATLLDADKPSMYFWGRNPFPRVVRLIHARAQNESPQGLSNEVAFGVSCALADVLIAVQGRRRVAAH